MIVGDHVNIGANLRNRNKLDAFLAEEEQKAFRVARVSVGNDDDALDVIQDAMLKFVNNYAEKSIEQWRPLFYKVVYSRLTDFHRRRNFRRGIMRFLGTHDDEHLNSREIDNVVSESLDPQQQLQVDGALEQLQLALKKLPSRQQQAVLMRAWHGFDTNETALIMQVSTGSVKTHYSRGLEKLRDLLGADWP